MQVKRLLAICVFVAWVVFVAGASVSQAQDADDKWTLATAIQKAATKVKPLVVSVETRFDKPRTGFPLYEYFRGTRPLYGLFGSGFFYKGKYVLTVNGLMEHMAHCKVILSDGRSYEAKLVGENVTFGVAVLEVLFPPGMSMPEPSFLDSDKVVLGMPICVIGRSMDGDDTFATEGIISAVRKETVGTGVPTEEYFQFDANYEFTFDGGAVVDANGNIIGMVTSTENVNLNLAVPINDVLRVSDKIISGDVRDPWFGAEVMERTVNIDIIYDLDCLPFKNGLFITYIEPNSPADLSGLKSGDVIESVDGKLFDYLSEFSMIKRRFAIGQQVKIVFWRDCKKFDLVLTILPTPESLSDSPSDEPSSGSGKPPGHHVREFRLHPRFAPR